MKFTKQHTVEWNSNQELPEEIYVTSENIELAEWELLAILARLHRISPIDILTGADSGTEKDRDLGVLLKAFQAYQVRIPLTHYTIQDEKIKNKNKK